MKSGTLFHDRLAENLVAQDAVSETLGPARMGRCQQLSMHGRWADDTTQGDAVVEWSWHQDFPAGGTQQLDTITWAAAGGSFVLDIQPKYWAGFVRVRMVSASDGDGLALWAQGRR